MRSSAESQLSVRGVKRKLRRVLYEPGFAEQRNKYLLGANNVQDLLTDLYGDEINHLEGILPEFIKKESTYTSILQGFYAFAFDSGLSRNISFHYRGEKVEAEPVYMLRRSAFLERTRKKLEQMEHKKAAFLMLDVADVGFADMVEDERKNGIKSADLLLNRFAGALQQAIDQTQKELDDAFGKNTIGLMAGRYGGDEFIVSVLGDYDQGVIQKVKDSIQRKVSEQQNVAVYRQITFQNGEEVVMDVKGDARLKDDKISVVELPTENPYSQKIFMHYLRQGLVLDQEQIEYIKDKFSEAEFDKDVTERYNSRFKYYIDGKPATTQQKIRFILRHHPELKLAFRLAGALDEAETVSKGGERLFRRQEAMLNFVQTTLFDPLLGYGVYGFFDFKEHMSHEPIERLMIFDLKLKELNDLMGLAYTDSVLDKFWLDISRAIGEDNMKKIIFGRRGGTFYLAVKKGEELSDSVLKELALLDRIPFSPEGSSIKLQGIYIPVGVAGLEKPINDLTHEADQEAKDNFYTKIVNELLKNPTMVEFLQKSARSHEFRNELDTTDFYWQYFRGKRFYFRCRDIIRYIPLDEKGRELIAVFQNIIKEKSNS